MKKLMPIRILPAQREPFKHRHRLRLQTQPQIRPRRHPHHRHRPLVNRIQPPVCRRVGKFRWHRPVAFSLSITRVNILRGWIHAPDAPVQFQVSLKLNDNDPMTIWDRCQPVGRNVSMTMDESSL